MQNHFTIFDYLRRAVATIVMIIIGLLCVVSPVNGQGTGDFIYTVGTTVRDAAGRDWAYIMWQATQPQLLTNKVFAIYAKSGEATNTASYSRVAIVQTQTDPRVIEPLLERAQFLGDNLNQLQVDLADLFGSFIPPTAISRGEQLSAVFRGALGDSRHYPNLILLARNHVGINLALGLAYAQRILSGSTTFEVRAYDLAKEQDLAVLGRVTVEAGAPVVLPAPGAPVELIEKSAMGDMNVRLRWGTPDDLRRLTLMQFGYDLYRVAQPYAASMGWNISNPPPLNTLLNLTTNFPARAKRINSRPITPSQLFTVTEAATTNYPGNTNLFFIMDDDGRGKAAYVNLGFTNGAKFLYYVAARDVLGRNGALSLGTQVTICDRMPPLPPTAVHVVNDYYYNVVAKTNRQTLRVNWRQNMRTNDSISGYWIYRWTNMIEFNEHSRFALSNLIAVVPHIPNATNNTYLDTYPGTVGNYDHTVWYSVRAADNSACDTNLSGSAGPAYGVLRDRVGPDPGTGLIRFNCLNPSVVFDGTFLATNSTATNFVFVGLCQNATADFEWAEFYAVMEYAGSGGNLLVTNHPSPVLFNGSYVVQVKMDFARLLRETQSQGKEPVGVQIFCRAGLASGKTSAYTAAVAVGLPGIKQQQNVLFHAQTKMDRTAINSGTSPCRHHPSGGGDDTNNITVTIMPTPTSEEYRVYRRIDAGPITLLAQGPITNVASAIYVVENSPPVNGGTVCFYLQLLDGNGNPSPMVPLGCVDSDPVTPLPVPTLNKIKPLGTSAHPGMRLDWFSPPYGVERFAVRVAKLQDSPPSMLPVILSPTDDLPITLTFTNTGTNLATAPFASFITPMVGPGFGSGSSFTVDCDIESGKTYAISVCAVGKGGYKGGYSEFRTFCWVPTNAPGPQVPWPARPLPTVANTNWPGGLLAATLSPSSGSVLATTAAFEGNGVLIGQGDVDASSGVESIRRPVRIGGTWDPNLILNTNLQGQTLFPCAMYRVQVTNAIYPTVSGDVIQVTPLMENIAWQRNASVSSTNTVIHDPFIVFSQQIDGATQNSHLWLWLADTQPVISGAKYRYLLVRFKDNHEIDQIIPSNDVTVP